MNNINERQYSNDEYNNQIHRNKDEQFTNCDNMKPILVLSIEISQGENEILKIYSNSQPSKLAYEFCNKHNLDYNSLQLLTDQITHIIKGNIEKYSNTKEEASIKSSTVSYSSSNIHNNKRAENGVQLIQKEHSKQDKYYQMNNNTSRHSLSYQIPTYSSRSKSKKCNQLTIKKEETTSIASSQPLMKSKNPNYYNNNHIINTGERLYFKGKKLQEKKEEKINLMKKQLLKSNSAIYTFKPKINTISNQTMRNRVSNHLTYNDDNKILNYNQYVTNKITSLKEKHCDNSEYTFSPLISKKSNQIDQAKMRYNIVSRHELLYENYKKQQLNLKALSNQIYDKNVLFKPQINNFVSQYSGVPFEERQKYFINKLTEKKKMLREEFESPEDEKTGQKLFHPEINDYDRSTSPSGYNIFNSLYTEALRVQRKKKENEENKILERQLNSNFSHVNVDSEEIYENKKMKCFEQIFSLLDRDKDGIITNRSIEIKALPKQIGNILWPIIDELRAEDETLNQDEFVTACFHLFDMLEYIEKKQLLTFAMNTNFNKNLQLNNNIINSKEKEGLKYQYSQSLSN